ncbi:hypothetical protein U27_01466 [Candidatus Vecturithrix granuli]|uniref:DUF547 domain-containing protein n=1 Tax=Vecturithrix granuli TaxID=1499967 RepID=A0A081CAG0_VECG1|nr:hypothetical protein U27_01466 [Candidatus Vecturithrix granuli]
MRVLRFVTTCAIFVFGVFLLVSSSSSQAETIVDNAIYAELLEKYLQDGVVNYEGLKTEETRLDQYLALLDQTDPDALARNEQFAFYMNAYNAYTLKLIVEHYPVKSIKDIGGLFKSPWKIKFCKVGGETLTLDDIEHNILRPRFQDARVHFAINCAAKDCPPLISVPYQGAMLDQQLDANTRAFLNNPAKTYLDGDTLWVSSIFKWFGEDFNKDPLSFVLTYAEGDFKQRLEDAKDRIKVKYLKYDWSLNGQ